MFSFTLLQLETNSQSVLLLLISLRLFPGTPNWLLNLSAPLLGISLPAFFVSVLIGECSNYHAQLVTHQLLPTHRSAAIQPNLCASRPSLGPAHQHQCCDGPLHLHCSLHVCCYRSAAVCVCVLCGWQATHSKEHGTSDTWHAAS